jgi:hypothetical protein
VRREKREEDLRDRVIEELTRIAFADVRDVVSWKREPVLSPDGEVLDIVERISVTASDKLSMDAAAAIKGVFHKSGQIRVEMHDKQSALLALAKHLNLFDDPPSGPRVTVNQVNVGSTNALDLAQRVAFLFGQAEARGSRIGAQPVQISEDTVAPASL